ncbi:endonuclease/exonuclease/phosphatase family protein [Kitasatospora mediocidica]|uniref:endonuclease/exonuclease/phosphatase family protein n=1 Tax=Kitasatospora mediocidica TaxID=58352 RepID=UPI00055C9145|nr:endonuclease/exonuclease/phosphatase family protein [Kitasatospora mediocidica]
MGLVREIRREAPHLLFLQEVDWLADPDEAAAAGLTLGMQVAVAPSRNLPTAVAWHPDALRVEDVDTRYSEHDLHQGYCAPRFARWGLTEALEAPLVAISTHLTPYSADTAAQEAQLLVARAYRYGGFGMIAGDINHVPLGDDEIDWTLVQPYNRTARCKRRQHPDDPWEGNRIVGEVLRDGEFADVAAVVAERRHDQSPLKATGKAGLLRVDQAHTTRALSPAIEDCRVAETDFSDHHGLVFTLDLSKADNSAVRTYT